MDSKEPDLRRPGIYCTERHAGGRLLEGGNTFLGWRMEPVVIQRLEIGNEWVAGMPHPRGVEENLHADRLVPCVLPPNSGRKCLVVHPAMGHI